MRGELLQEKRKSSLENIIKSDVKQIPCDTTAITAVGCGLTDYACHCANSDKIRPLALPCLQNNSTCSSSDLGSEFYQHSRQDFCQLKKISMADNNIIAFATLVGEICNALNVTSSGNATTASQTPGATIPVTKPTSVPVTGTGVRFGYATGFLVAGMGFAAWVL
jgi:hypothetical protein